MRITNCIRSCWSQFMLVAGLVALAATAGGATENGTKDEFTWSAELVSVDQSAGAVTLKAPVESHAAIKDFSKFNRGDRVTLTWTGISLGVGIYDIKRGSDTDGSERLKLPAEFVSASQDGKHISFKVPIPKDQATRIASLKQGNWVTATSPRAVSGYSNAVVAIRPFSQDPNA